MKAMWNIQNDVGRLCSQNLRISRLEQLGADFLKYTHGNDAINL